MKLSAENEQQSHEIVRPVAILQRSSSTQPQSQLERLISHSSLNSISGITVPELGQGLTQNPLVPSMQPNQTLQDNRGTHIGRSMLQHQYEGIGAADQLLSVLLKLQHQAQAFHQTSTALQQILPRHAIAQLSASLQNSGFGLNVLKPTATPQEKVSLLAPGNLGTSMSGGLFSGNIFDNCSPGSLIGSLKPFVKKESDKVKLPQQEQVSMFGTTIVEHTQDNEPATNQENSQPIQNQPQRPARQEPIRRSITQKLGFRRIIKNKRQDKLKSKLLKVGSPRKSVLQSASKHKSPSKIASPSAQSPCKDRSSPKKKTLFLTKSKEKCQTKAKEVVYTINESSEFLAKRKRKTEKQLSVLQNELRGNNLLWSREKIAEIASRTGMTETQIYKWWWDQTRKRVKKLKSDKNAASMGHALRGAAGSEDATRDNEVSQNSDPSVIIKNSQNAKIDTNQSENDLQQSASQSRELANQQSTPNGEGVENFQDQNFMVPTIDEFGGYSSRLRIPDQNQVINGAEDATKRTASGDKMHKSNSFKIKIQTSVTAPKKKSLDDLSMQSNDQNVKPSNGIGFLSVGQSLLNQNQSLCHLLGINVDEIARQIVVKDKTARQVHRCKKGKGTKISDKIKRLL